MAENSLVRKIITVAIITIAAVFMLLFLNNCGEEVEEENGGTLLSISVSPVSANLKVGETQVFTPTALYSGGVVSTPQASWSVNEAIGSIEAIGLNALFTATAEGTGEVIAEYNGKLAIATVTVAGFVTTEVGELATIEVSPATSTVRVGEKQVFTASGLNTSNEAMDVAPTWTVTGDAIGVLTASGSIATLEVQAEGFAYINVISGEVAALAYITAEGFMAEITAEADTYVSTPESGSHGTDITLIAGRVTDPSPQVYETYIKFDISFVPAGATVEVAELKLYCTDTDGAAIKVGRLAGAWNETVTWESRPSLESFLKSYTFDSGENEIEFKDLVQYWIDTVNHGLAFYKDAPATGYVNLISKDDTSVEERRPKLYLEYITH